jgi:hypothetical protein
MEGPAGRARRGQRTSMLARSRGETSASSSGGEAPSPRSGLGGRVSGAFGSLLSTLRAGGPNIKSVLALALVAVLLLLLTDTGGVVHRAVGNAEEAPAATSVRAPVPRTQPVAVAEPASGVQQHVPWSGTVPRKVGSPEEDSSELEGDLASAQAVASAVAASWTRRSPPPAPESPPPPRPPRAPYVSPEPRVPGLLTSNVDGSTPGWSVPPLSRDLVEAYSEPVPEPAEPDEAFNASRRVLVVSFTDWRPHGTASQQTQAHLASNWVHTMSERGMPCLVVLCEPQAPGAGAPAEVGTRLVARPGVPGESPPLGCGLAWSDAAACVTNPRVGRWYMVSQLMSWGYDVMSTDPDVAFLRNPLPYFSALMLNHPAVDVFTSSDSNNGVYIHQGGSGSGGGVPSPDGQMLHSMTRVTWNNSVGPLPPRWAASFPQLAIPSGYVFRSELRGHDGHTVNDFLAALRSGAFDIGLESPGNCQPHQYNSGCMYWRATPRAGKLIAKWLEALDSLNTNPTADDQVPINNVAKTGAQHCQPGGGPPDGQAGELCGGDRLLNGVGGGLACLGLLNLVQFANGFVYTTSRAHEQHGVAPYVLHATYAGDKVLKLREEGLFHDTSDWYDGGSGFLTYDVDLPAWFFANDTSVDPPDGHYTWVNHWHLVQHQLQQLRAALAIAQATGRVLVLPRMACACECFFYPGRDCVIEGHRVRLPHVCPTDHWLRPGRLAQPHREPGFLENPRLPAAVRDDVATVTWCGTASCDPATEKGITVAAALDDVALRSALAPVASARILRLVGVRDIWAGFADEKDGAKFNSSLTHGVLSSWCCLKQHPDGRNDTKVEVWKVPYAWEGEPNAVPDHEDVGKCGA